MSLRPSSSREEARKKTYKIGVDGDGDEARRRREQSLVEIRKNERGESLKKRRDAPTLSQHGARNEVESVPLLLEKIWSQDPATQLEATEILSEVDEVIKAGVIPRFVEFLGKQELPQLQVVTALVLGTMASGKSQLVQVMVDNGVVPLFVKLLSSESDDVREQAVMALGNIASNSSVFRDTVISHGAVMPILAQLNKQSSVCMRRAGTRTLANLCCGYPPSAFEKVKPALPVLGRLILSSDEEILKNACWALSDLSNGPNEQIQAVIDSGVCPRLVELLMHKSFLVVLLTLRAVTPLITRNHTQFVVESQVLPHLFYLITQEGEKFLQKEACWTIACITVRGRALIQAVFDANIMGPLIHLLKNADFYTKKEAAWAIVNAINHGSSEQIRFFVNQDCIPPLCALLDCSEPDIVTVCLEGLDSILKEGDAIKDMHGGVNPYTSKVEACNGLEKIENLLMDRACVMENASSSLIDTYFEKNNTEGLRQQLIVLRLA